jgi:hypothetical protein
MKPGAATQSVGAVLIGPFEGSRWGCGCGERLWDLNGRFRLAGHGELRKVGEPCLSAGARRSTTRNCGKAAEVDSLGTFRFQICFQERGVADLIVRVVVDVLGHVAVQNGEGSR